ncbi:tryptophan-rich sensory protein [Robiginitalea sp. SC105]|uniref:tryptophan-rich sensory protein n=1 Tax=Robiginitalea sp. SC105 TaxID=2762332 RepID=UPI00163A011D|nr:tryptophan-rich sensory protein [Robiginitalea sp. SC105]MBC2838514.1 tryptophan-rich sensory protein [Robiginitalea sp. SC105]
MDKTLSYLNLLSVFLVLGVNGASQSGAWPYPTVGEISRKFDTLFTPAGYAFSIWGLIFLGLLGFAGYSIYRSHRYSQGNEYIARSAPWFIGANILNAAWVVVFTREWIGTSLLIMFALLACLIAIIRRLNMERWDAPIGTIAYVWWPICLYSSWISVAAIANAALYLNYMGWDGWGLGAINWTVALILVAIALNVFMVLSRNMREFALVGAWALLAIAVRHREASGFLLYTPLAGTALLGILAAWHGFRNRATNPMEKFRQRFTHGNRKNQSNTL